jgi:pyruvyltransferase
MTIKACWYKAGGNNFGDVICPILLHALTGQEIEFSRDEGTLVSIGSVAFHPYDNKMLFWGSGAITKKSKPKHQHPHEVFAVRGPITRKRFLREGFECPEIYGDPGMLLPLLFPLESFDRQHRIEVGVLPHKVDYEHVREFELINDDKFELIDIHGDTMEVLKAITSCDFLITSSLHGLIVGEAYSIPTVFVEFGKRLWGRLFKFKDYFESTNRPLKYYRCYHQRAFNLSKIENFHSKQMMPVLDLKPLVSAFPYPIVHPGILNFMNEKIQ